VPSYDSYLKSEEEGNERRRGRGDGEWKDRDRRHHDSRQEQTRREEEDQAETAEDEKKEEEAEEEDEDRAMDDTARRREVAVESHHPRRPHRSDERRARSGHSVSRSLHRSHAPPPPPAAASHPAHDPARLIEAVQAKRDRHDRHLSNPPPPPSNIPPLRLPHPPPSSTFQPSTRAALRAINDNPFDVAYGYDGLTPGSIEREKEAERREYEAELARIREDPTNRETRFALKERMNRWRNIV
jgi:hypothetical protein